MQKLISWAGLGLFGLILMRLRYKQAVCAIVFSLGFAFEVQARLEEKVLNLCGEGGPIFFFRFLLVWLN